MFTRNVIMAGLLALLSVGGMWNSQAADRSGRTDEYGLGQAATDRDMQKWNIDVTPTGRDCRRAAEPPSRAQRFLPLIVPPVMDRLDRKVRWIV